MRGHEVWTTARLVSELHRGDAVWSELDPVRGREQSGHRPPLVVASDLYLEQARRHPRNGRLHDDAGGGRLVAGPPRPAVARVALVGIFSHRLSMSARS